ncbi:secreted RxLR effector protein 161-like [Cryptomeria japonica]|uniref:secreted RxLR effector protein 161-like n=1 Tax=Cryptomeria japonica TaxID=3369 RepID=UPI0027DA8A36|nr:secreted RxLR effector protein 161-like [Cryptomeria japonica]
MVHELKAQLSGASDMKDLGATRGYIFNVPYASAIGILMCAMIYTRPDITQAMAVVSRTNSVDKTLDIQGFIDVDWASDLDSRRSTNGYVFTLFGGAISWTSKRYPAIALSITEVEYTDSTHVSKEAVWLQRLCASIGFDCRTV